MVVAFWWCRGFYRCLHVNTRLVDIARTTTETNTMAVQASQCDSCFRAFKRKDTRLKHINLNRCPGPMQRRQSKTKTERDISSRKERTEATINVNGESYHLQRNQGSWGCPCCEEKFSRSDAVRRHLLGACRGRQYLQFFFC